MLMPLNEYHKNKLEITDVTSTSHNLKCSFSFYMMNYNMINYNKRVRKPKLSLS